MRKEIIAVLLAGLLLLSACVTVPGPQQPEDKKQITVSNTAENEIPADMVEISLGIETIAKDAKTSQEQNAEIATAIMTALNRLGLGKDEIETGQYSVYPRQDWDQTTSRSKITGYSTTNMIIVKTSRIDIAGAIIDAGAQAGANRVNNVQFTLSKAAEETAKTAALKMATEGAKGKAQAIADGLGVKLLGVASVNEANVYFPPMYMRGYETAMALDKAEAVAMPPIEAGDLTVTATVNVVYNIG